MPDQWLKEAEDREDDQAAFAIAVEKRTKEITEEILTDLDKFYLVMEQTLFSDYYPARYKQISVNAGTWNAVLQSKHDNAKLLVERLQFLAKHPHNTFANIIREAVEKEATNQAQNELDT